MSDMKKIKELITLMKRQKVRRLKINEKGLDVDIELEPTHHAEFHPHPHIPTTHSTPAPAAAEPAEASGTFIKSPLVGTFYTSPGPNEPAFVKPGDKVSADTVVCIVEAMKVMNEVRAGRCGDS